MATNGFLPVATGAGANVITDAALLAADFLAQGFQSGTARSNQVNKVLRQGSVAASTFGQFIADWSQQDALDSLSIGTLETRFRIALAETLAAASYAADTSTTPNLITAALDPVPATLTGFREIRVKVANTNTGVTILTLNGFASKPVVRRDGAPVQAGDLLQGRYYGLIYDGTSFRLTGAVVSEGGAGGAFSGALMVALKSADQSVSAGTFADLTWATPAAGAIANIGSFDGTTVTIGSGNAGRYRFRSKLQMAITLSGSSYVETACSIWKNGNSQETGGYLGTPGGSGVWYGYPTVDKTMDLIVGDQVKIRGSVAASGFVSGSIKAVSSTYSTEYDTILEVTRLL